MLFRSIFRAARKNFVVPIMRPPPRIQVLETGHLGALELSKLKDAVAAYWVGTKFAGDHGHPEEVSDE